MKRRVNAYIDGFNLYHSIAALGRAELKWLNLRSLIEVHLKDDEVLGDVKYFTAYASWNQDKQRRHKRYVKALKRYDIKVVLGKFKKKHFNCENCGYKNKSREEKRTDVNIAISILQEAFYDKYDSAIIVSGDTDLIPAIDAVRNTFPDKKIGILFPPSRHTNEMAKASDFCHTIKIDSLENSLLPDKIRLPSNKFLTSPDEWK